MTEKKCTDCVHYVKPDQTAETFGFGLAVPACAQLERLLGRFDKPQHWDHVAVVAAAGCDSYSVDEADRLKKAKRTVAAFVVGTASASALADAAAVDGLTAPSTCSKCRFFVRDYSTRIKFGVTDGICVLRGQAIPSNRTRFMASACGQGQQSISPGVRHYRTVPSDMEPMPFYTDGIVALAEDVGKAVLTAVSAKATEFVEPTTYETDREVTADDRQFGIRAWRRLHNPKNRAKYVDLPVFDIDFFDPAEQARIPRTGDSGRPEWYVDHGGYVYRVAAAWMGIDKTPALWGHSGVGKTEALRHIAWMMCLPYTRLNIRPDTETSELVGEKEFSVPPSKLGDPGATPETWWNDGPLTLAWERPGVIAIDEANMAPPDTWALLRSMTDDHASLKVNGVERPRHTFAFLGMAMNPSWSPLYVGTRDLADADRSRITNINVVAPPEALERAIIIRRCELNDPPYEPDPAIVDAVMGISRDLRAQVEEGMLPLTWGVRENQAVLQLTGFLDLEDAYRMAVVDYLEPGLGEEVLRVVRTHDRGVK